MSIARWSGRSRYGMIKATFCVCGTETGFQEPPNVTCFCVTATSSKVVFSSFGLTGIPENSMIGLKLSNNSSLLICANTIDIVNIHGAKSYPSRLCAPVGSLTLSMHYGDSKKFSKICQSCFVRNFPIKMWMLCYTSYLG